jgi:hypothetical protein
VTNRRDSETELRSAFESLVGLARQSPDPSEVDYALLRLQLVLKTQVSGIAMALDTMASGPDEIGAACYDDVRAIASGKINMISLVVDDLPRLAGHQSAIDPSREQDTPAPRHLAREP